MVDRPELQTKLEELLGSENVYYQPPNGMQMKYDAIVYSRDGINNTFAGNAVYNQAIAYKVTVISPKPDCDAVKKLSKMPLCKFVRHFTSDKLHHDVFTLYY